MYKLETCRYHVDGHKHKLLTTHSIQLNKYRITHLEWYKLLFVM